MNRPQSFKSSMSACIVYDPYYSDIHVWNNDEVHCNIPPNEQQEYWTGAPPSRQ
jgi:hypothetical protein